MSRLLNKINGGSKINLNLFINENEHELPNKNKLKCEENKA